MVLFLDGQIHLVYVAVLPVLSVQGGEQLLSPRLLEDEGALFEACGIVRGGEGDPSSAELPVFILPGLDRLLQH